MIWKNTSVIICAVLGLLAIGVIMLTSTSGAFADYHYHDTLYFVKRQCLWILVGLIVMAIVAAIDYRHWQNVAIPLYIICVVMLFLVLVPHIGVNIKGSRRWLRLGPMNFQPSEAAKLASVLILSWWMTRVQRYAKELKRGAIFPFLFMGGVLLPVLVEPDFGTTLLIALAGMFLLFMAGTRPIYLLSVLGGGGSLFAIAIMHNAERMRRIIAFLDPEKYAQDEAFQLLNAIYAFVVGGGMGAGLGQSMQKQFYLPEAHTDFIFAILGEELGLAATVLVLCLFGAFFLTGLLVSYRANSDFGRFLALGITMTITLQAALNIGVVTGCLPTKGLPLPFISFGGSSIVVTLTMVGMLISIARYSLAEANAEVVEEEEFSSARDGKAWQ